MKRKNQVGSEKVLSKQCEKKQKVGQKNACRLNEECIQANYFGQSSSRHLTASLAGTLWIYQLG